jgi:hypothetical protein
VNTAAVNVNWETTVLAAEVRTAATSGVGSEGVGLAPQAVSSSTRMRRTNVDFVFIVHPIFVYLDYFFTSKITVNGVPK